VTLKLFNLAGTEVASSALPIAAGQLAATNTSSLGVGVNQAGFGLLIHDGPGGTLLVDAAIANFGTSPAAIIPAKFQELRAQGPSGGGEGGSGGGAGSFVLKSGDTMTGALTIMTAGTGLSVSDDVLVGGTLMAGSYLGNGAGLTGITGATGGVGNTGSTTIAADQDDDNLGEIAFVTKNLTRMTVRNDGRVGIGTTNPMAELEVEESGVVTADSTALMVDNTATNTTTDGIEKTGLEVTSTGAFTGGGGADTMNIGLKVEVSGADVNAAATFTGGPVSIGPTGPIDPRILLKVENTDSVTTTDRTLQVDNSATNTTTDGIDKVGVEIMSTGDFSGSGGTDTVNTGLAVTVSGADINQAATFTGGNVGIGTTSPDPTKTLEVVGDVLINSNLDVDGTVTALFFVGDGSGLTNLPGGSGTVTSLTEGNGIDLKPQHDHHDRQHRGELCGDGLRRHRGPQRPYPRPVQHQQHGCR
jgi:hypothetical protein